MTTAPARPSSRRAFLAATLLYAALIVYGSLYPLTGWKWPVAPLFSFLLEPVPDYVSPLTDVLTNFLAYLPLGILLVWTLRLKGKILSILVAGLSGGTLSFTMESIQMFLPSRTASNQDLLTDIVGTLFGATLGLIFGPNSAIMSRLTSIRDDWFTSDPGTSVGIGAVFLWILSLLSPFVPSMDVSTVRQGLAPLWYTLHNPSSLSWLKVIAGTLDMLGMGLLVTTITRRPTKIAPFFLLLVGLLVCLQPFIIGRQISLEAICALAAAGILLMAAPKRRALRALLSMLSVLGGFITAELIPTSGTTHAFNWVPFAGQIDNTVAGFGSILEGIWPFVALSALTMLGFGVKRKAAIYVGGFLLLLVFALEWVQQDVAGRYGDITTVILAVVGWISPWLCVGWQQKPALTVAALPETMGLDF